MRKPLVGEAAHARPLLVPHQMQIRAWRLGASGRGKKVKPFKMYAIEEQKPIALPKHPARTLSLSL